MFKRSLMVMTTLLALPAFANAWYVNAKTSTTGQGTISPSGTQTYATGVDSGEYTVSPALGFTVSRVTLDGLQAAPNGNGKYVAPYLASKSTRYLVAYFATKTVNITTSATGSGAVREDTFESLTNVPAGSARQILILPNPGYQVSTFDPADGTVTNDPVGFAPGSKLVSFTNLQANKTVSATFSAIPVFDMSAGNDITVNGPGSAFAANLIGSATSNQGAITYAWTVTGGPSSWTTTDLVFGTPTAASTTVYANSSRIGNYTVTLTATSNGVPKTDTAVVTVLDGKAFYANQCTGCHSMNNPTLVNNYTTGAHGTASGHTTGTCQRCHATDGALAGASSGWTGGYSSVLVPYSSTVWRNNKPVVSAAGVACLVCHDEHNGLRPANTYVSGAKVAWDPNGNNKVDQYDVCTSCHTLTDNAGAVVGNYHNGGSINYARTVSDTHHDNPATGVGLASNVVEGYVIRKNSATPCADCHNVHSASLEIQEAWADSAHAGKIAAKKAAAIAAAPQGNTDPERLARLAASTNAGALDDAEGNAWTHYNWDQTSSRGSCQRCHTATGISNFLNNPAAYNAAGTNNDFSHLSGWTAAAGSPQQELLYCWGCHSDSQTGALRNPGAITEVYAAATAGAPAATVSYPDAGKSNVCMGCHLGREVGQNVKNDTDTDGVRAFINSHYLAAGGMVYGEAGYEFAGRDYTKNFQGHASVGNADDKGPCVTCHMTSSEAHVFEVVTKDAAGVITGVASTSCASCHGNMNAAYLEERKEVFHGALEALKDALENKGIFFYPAHPYFYNGANGTGGAFTNWAGVYGLASWKDVMGAAFNYNLIEHDPGAYAHNRTYSLKLIADSIDFLADGVTDNVGTFTAGAPGVIHSGDLLSPVKGVIDITIDAKHLSGTALVKAQYVAPTTSFGAGSCTDCHSNNNTAASATIIDQFAESAHGDVKGEAWWHYDWRSSSRAACARCHNATAYVAKLGIESNTTNIFTAADANKAGEVLACNACHTDLATGAVRTPGPYTETYADGTGVTLAFPDVGKSNLCMRCHSGRESGGTIAADADADGDRSFINSHYLTAGGTIFTTTGYEFSGQDYTNLPYYEHDKAGIADPLNPAATDAGPCASCHMGNGTANHTWEVVAKDATGLITGITSNSCNTCHAGAYTLTPALLNEEAEGYHAALEALKAALDAKGIYFYAASPYFYTAPYVVGGTNTSFTKWNLVATSLGLPAVPGYKQVMGAAFNYNLLHHDPGGYAHNSLYSKRLIFDSIDFIQDGVLDGTLDLSASPAAAAYLQGNTNPADDNAVARP